MNIKNLLYLTNKKLIEELEEDLNGVNLDNDITTKNLFPKTVNIKCIISNRERMILCGAKFIEYFLKKNFPRIKYQSLFRDGENIKKNSRIFILSGNAKIILGIERTILNFLQHLSSISTTTHKFVTKMGKVETKLLDTRKTTIGLRKIEKYATFIGGAENHRIGLYDNILIKDNHIKIIGNINKTLKVLKSRNIEKYKIECESFKEVKKSVKIGAKYILLDNMKVSEIRKCIKFGKNLIEFEITGGITINNIDKYAKLGASYISTGKITNSPYSVDIGLDII